MIANTFDKKPFSQETITKLDIFEEYLRAWLPVFVQSPWYKEINICDFFAGEGNDLKGNQGSPLRILKVIHEYKDSIIMKGMKINILLNELNRKKFESMKQVVDKELSKIDMDKVLSVEFRNSEFQQLFKEKSNKIKDMPNLLFLDQYGIKEITDNVFFILESFKKTDFLFFIATSYLNRFLETKEVQTYFPDLNIKKIKKSKYFDLHRLIIDYYRKKLPELSKTKLYPFTIKKLQNIYGLIFGSKNVLGIEKFLQIAWKENRINGEANFDIDNDIQKQQEMLFPEMKRKTKIEKFEDDLKDFILNSVTVTNFDVYNFALENGFLPSHASSYIRKLRNKKIIKFSGPAKINYGKCYKNFEEVKFEVIK